jgi:ribosomal protein L37AE/L43A
MVNPSKKEENITWVCPFCKKRYTAPLTAGVRSRCQYCGKEWLTEGVEVGTRDSQKLQDEMQRRRKREIEADKEHE